MKKGFAVLTGAVLAASAFIGLGAHGAFADQRDFRQYNNSSVAIMHEYISPASMENWGVDQLHGDVIMPGDYYDFLFSRVVDSGACVFDIRIDASDGTTTKEWGVNLCRTDTLTFS